MYSVFEEILELDKGIPYTPEWSAAPDFIQTIVDYVLREKPRTIVECSSGLTTVMLARCCQMNRQGHVYSLENGAEYAAKTRSYFERYGLDDYATILDAPLEKISVNGADYHWYHTDGLDEHLAEQSIEMLVIDGPPGFIQKNSRYPALPLLFEKLSDHCTIFLDDAARDDEKVVVDLWVREHPGVKHQYIDAERGCSILTLNR